MANLDQAFPRLDTQAVDPRTGRLTQPWYRFFISLWTRSGGGGGFDIASLTNEAETAFFSDLMDEPRDEGQGAALLSMSDERIEADDPLRLIAVSDGDGFDQSVPNFNGVTAGASPVTFSARMLGSLLINGGTITALSLTRGGTVLTVPVAATWLPLSPGDTASVTYSVAPTLTFVPR